MVCAIISNNKIMGYINFMYLCSLMVIDYKHPIVQKMKTTYREARDAYEDAADSYKRYRKKRGVSKEKALEDYESAVGLLGTAKSKIAGLIDKMKEATDLSKEDRDYYVPYMGNYLTNISKWLEEAKPVLEGLKK